MNGKESSMKVTLKSQTTRDIVEYISDFARVSRDRDEADTTPQQDLALCKRLWKDNERTAYESINLDFLVEDVSRSLLAQITRYRHATFMVKSQRYVKLDSDDEFIFPDLSYIKNKDNIEKCYDLFAGTSLHIKANYLNLTMLGAKPEDARAILLNATPTRFRIVCNLRSFLNFYEQRSTEHAQKEIRELAEDMFSLLCKKLESSNDECLLFWIKDSFKHTIKDLIKELKEISLRTDMDSAEKETKIDYRIEEYEEFV